MIATAARIAKATPRSRRAWAPNADDHQIYRWVRFDGKSQCWAANQFGISQATVSRVIQRYERWQAHADPRDGGQLDPAERARAQRWLTYERNELIIASALRLASDLEGFTDTSKTVTSHPQRHPTQDSVVRTENAVIDRSGLVARFLRLAARVNMDQQKFVQSDAPPKPEPLSEEEIAEQEAEAAAAEEEIRAARQASDEQANQRMAEHLAANGEWEALRNFQEACAVDAARKRDAAGVTETPGLQLADAPEESHPVPPTRGEAMHNVHNLHNGSGDNVAVTNYADTSCDETCQPEKACDGGCITPTGERNAAEGAAYNATEGAAYTVVPALPDRSAKGHRTSRKRTVTLLGNGLTPQPPPPRALATG